MVASTWDCWTVAVLLRRCKDHHSSAKISSEIEETVLPQNPASFSVGSQRLRHASHTVPVMYISKRNHVLNALT